jgi:hypothetical protein
MRSDIADGATSGKRGSRAGRSGPHARFVAALAAAVALAGAAVVLVAHTGGNPQSSALTPKDYTTKYGTIPGWIPDAIPKPEKDPLATMQKPVTGRRAGFAVHVVLPFGMSTVTSAGPEVPASASQHASAIGTGSPVPVRFEVTFHATTGSVPLRAGAFSIQTVHGTVTPTVSASGRGDLPPKVPVGHNITLWLSTSLIQGPGMIRWTPQGKSPVVAWQYTFELD